MSRKPKLPTTYSQWKSAPENKNRSSASRRPWGTRRTAAGPASSRRRQRGDADGRVRSGRPLLLQPPREGWLLRCLGARSHCYCCLDPIPPTEGGGERKIEALCAAPPESACHSPEPNATELPSCAHISARAAQRRRRRRWWRGEEGARRPGT